MTTLPTDDRAPFRNQRWVECDTTLDPYSVAMVDDADTQETFRTRLSLIVPNEDDMVNRLVVVGPHRKICTNDYPTYAKYNESDGTPVPGEEWGIKSGSSVLRSGCPGFVILGDESGGLVRVMRAAASQQFFLGKVVTSTISANSSGTVEKHNHAWSATSVYYTVYNPHDVDLPVNLRVRWGKYPGWNGWIVEPWEYTEC